MPCRELIPKRTRRFASRGTPQRMEYTAIGSTVNIASRLCDLARSGEVVVSEAVQSELKGSFESTALGEVQVKGIDTPLQIAKIKLAETAAGS